MQRLAANILRVLVRVYQLTLSPAFAALGLRCRHEPSCSRYADAALARHGAWAGAWMALARLMRCRPGGSYGFDPAPEDLPRRARWWAPWRYGDWRGPDREGKTKDNAEAHLS